MIYFIADGRDAVKIGYTRHSDVSARLGMLQVGNPRALTLLATCEGGPATERLFHLRLDGCRLRGEWFDLNDPDLQGLLREIRKHTYPDGQEVLAKVPLPGFAAGGGSDEARRLVVLQAAADWTPIYSLSPNQRFAQKMGRWGWLEARKRAGTLQYRRTALGARRMDELAARKGLA